jgi:hypothetical protein
VNTSWPILATSPARLAGSPDCLDIPPFWPAPTWMPLLAECWISVTNRLRTCGGSAAERLAAWLVMVDTSLFCSRAPTVAVPMTSPTCRTVLSTPDAAPAICGWMLRMATVISGANTQPMPNPATISGARKLCHEESGRAIRASQPIPAPNRVSPVIRMYLPPIRSVSRPANGATNIEISEAGAIASPAFSAEKPRTDCR